jgi:hypothetical protein
MASITTNISGNHETLQITDISESQGTTFDTIDLHIAVFTSEDSYKNSEADHEYSDTNVGEPTEQAPIELTPSDFSMTTDAFVDGIYKYTITFKDAGVTQETYTTTYLVIYNNDVTMTNSVAQIMRLILGDKNTKYLDDAFETNWEISTLDTIIYANVVGLLQESLEIKDCLDELLENN